MSDKSSPFQNHFIIDGLYGWQAVSEHAALESESTIGQKNQKHLTLNF